MINRPFRYYFLVLFFLSHLTLISQEGKQIQLDSIYSLRKLSKDKSKPIEERLITAKKACELSLITGIDSTILKSNNILSSLYLGIDENLLFGKLNKENLILNTKLNDSSGLARTHYNLGWYYYTQLKQDSSYFHYFNAAKLYNKLNDIKNEGEVLLNMADIQESEKDYIGSEQNAIRAITLIQSLPKDENNLETLWSLYNLLGVISFRTKENSKAVEYHKKALEFSSKMKDSYVYNLFSKNNIALAYRENKDYEKSLNEYDELLSDKDLINVFPEAYSSYLNNMAYTKFLAGGFNNDSIEKEFREAYSISDTLNDPVRLMFICNNISEFYLSNRRLDTSFHFAQKAYNIARKAKSYEEVLVSLKLMAKAKDNVDAKKYLNEHIRLSDSLLDEERAKRNKFARIEFETDQIKAENEQISKERLMFLISSVGLLITLVLLYVIISQRAKNKELKFSKAQQEANEEIYNLMLAQQDKVDEGRTQEKKRISEELHDGILGRLFGTRLSLDSLNFVNTDDAIKTRGQYIDELKSIEQEIRKISHDLNTDFVSGSSFSDIIQSYIETQTQAYQLSYEYHEDDDIDWDELSNKTKIHVYRMLQETMQNIYKHANAKHIKISFRLKNSVILLTVEDDGSGFNTNKARKGIGLKNFDSRAGEIGGKVEIFSNPGEGTKVIIHVPTE